MVLPAILNPFVEGAPAAVMTRIALDWIIDGTPLDELFDEVAAGQYTRELTLTHFVQVMLDVASGHRPSPRAAFLRRELAARGLALGLLPQAQPHGTGDPRGGRPPHGHAGTPAHRRPAGA